MEKINLFISYSHKEKDIYLPELLMYLNEKCCPRLNIWYDEKISPGKEWDDEIKKSLNNADIVILMLSQSFLMSRYIQDNELKNAIYRHNLGKCKVIPIFIRQCILDPYPEVKKLQGLPRDKLFINNMGEEKWGYYADITQRLNDSAEELSTEKNIKRSLNDNTNPTILASAKQIDQLRNNKKIFLSMPSTEEGKKRRQQFLYQVEGKMKYENWLYEIVPGKEDVEKFYQSLEIDQDHLVTLIQKATYSIHFVNSEESLKKGNDKIQYDLAKKYTSSSCCSKNIIWLLNSELVEKIDTEVKMNPVISGNDFEDVFELIRSLDDEKEKIIKELKKSFSTDKKIFMFYDFSKDLENELRINLKTKIEENKNLVVKLSVPNASLEKDKEDLSNCDGGCIFYGATDSQWFAMRQSILFDSGFARSKAICLDEPELQKKADRDVSTNAFITIKGKNDLEVGVKDFIKRL